MKFSFGSALAAGVLALAGACAHGNSDTKTAGNDTSTTNGQSASGTAAPVSPAGSGGDTNATGKSEATGKTATNDSSTGTTGSASGSIDKNGSMQGTAKAGDTGVSGQATGQSTSGTTASNSGDSKSGSVSGQAGDSTSTAQNSGSYGSTSDKSAQGNGTMGGMQGSADQKSDTAKNDSSTTTDSSKSDSSGSWSKSDTTKSDTGVSAQGDAKADGKTDGAMAGNDQGSMDAANMRSVTGSVTKVDSQGQSITLDQQAGSSLTLTVDSSTKVLRNGRPLLGIQSLREGQHIRASFDPASNKAQRIEIVGGKHHRHHDKAMDNGTTGSMNGTTGGDASAPGASDTGIKSKSDDKPSGTFDNGSTPPPAADSLPADKDSAKGTTDTQKKDQ